jgi:predicted TIM-barrel fold metal-dependent hydrolase
MPVNETWLSRHVEPVAEPDLPIIDAHHHLWDRPDQRYLHPDFRADLESGHRVVGSVFIEARSRQHDPTGTMYRADGPEALRPLGETEFINGIAAMARSGRHGPVDACAGIVAYVDLRLGDAAGPVIACHQAMPRVRGIRNMMPWHASPAIHNPELLTNPHMLAEPAFRAGFACLARTGLTFDAWIFAPQISA